jgi:hypothetical protein
MLGWSSIVQNFDNVVLYWTVVSLLWGITTSVVYYRLSLKTLAQRERVNLRKDDSHNIHLIWLINIVCVAYLAVSPFTSLLSTSFIVINIFYTNFLAYMSVYLYRWAQVVKRDFSKRQHHQPIIH